MVLSMFLLYRIVPPSVGKEGGVQGFAQVKLRQGADMLYMMGMNVPEHLVSCAELRSWPAERHCSLCEQYVGIFRVAC